MVVESIIDHYKAEKKPWEVFFIGMFYTFLAYLLSVWIFKNYASIISVFLIVLAAFPLFFFATKSEEEKDLSIEPERKILKAHAKVLKFFMYIFFGIVVAAALTYILFPSQIVNSLFKTQLETISHITGGYSSFGEAFKPVTSIFFNNMKVLVFSIIFSIVYGIGALFILAWNATVLGAAIGNFIRVNLEVYAAKEGLVNAASYLQIFSIGFAKYAIHGIPEILAYFIGGLAGGIISFSIINKDFKSPRFQRVITDSTYLVIISILILFIAAILEIFVTPLFF